MLIDGGQFHRSTVPEPVGIVTGRKVSQQLNKLKTVRALSVSRMHTYLKIDIPREKNYVAVRADDIVVGMPFQIECYEVRLIAGFLKRRLFFVIVHQRVDPWTRIRPAAGPGLVLSQLDPQ